MCILFIFMFRAVATVKKTLLSYPNNTAKYGNSNVFISSYCYASVVMYLMPESVLFLLPTISIQ